MELERRSSGIARAGLATGITGVSLATLGLIGGGAAAVKNANTNLPFCTEDHLVDRYTLDLTKKNSKLETENALLDATIKSEHRTIKLYEFVNEELEKIRENLCDQKVVNQRNSDSFQIVNERMGNLKNDFDHRLEIEARDRRCADNTIVTYSNATFYPKQIAAVTTSTDTVSQCLYNPLPGENCNGNCNCTF